MIDVCNLSVVRDGQHIVRDVSFSMTHGSVISLVGPNGAGKTTLLKALSGLLAVASGEIRIDGHAIETLSRRDLAKKVSYLPQRIDTPYPFSVRDFIMLSRYPHRSRWCGASEKDSEIVHSLIQRFDLKRIAEARLDKISGGELQRAYIAGALAQGATYLLLDEPTASLDPLQEERLFSMLHALRAEDDVGIIVSTHNLSRALNSDSCLALRDGTIVHAGSTDFLRSQKSIAELYQG